MKPDTIFPCTWLSEIKGRKEKLFKRKALQKKNLLHKGAQANSGENVTRGHNIYHTAAQQIKNPLGYSLITINNT